MYHGSATAGRTAGVYSREARQGNTAGNYQGAQPLLPVCLFTWVHLLFVHPGSSSSEVPPPWSASACGMMCTRLCTETSSGWDWRKRYAAQIVSGRTEKERRDTPCRTCRKCKDRMDEGLLPPKTAIVRCAVRVSPSPHDHCCRDGTLRHRHSSAGI